jgi:ubiquitin carboxyl-terminal hydrolase 5/13
MSFCADIYCYTCNDARVDPELAAHLNAFGINVSTQTKTEKSMTELVSVLSGQ